MLEIMFDWKLFWVMLIIALPGLIMSIGGFTRAYWPFIRTHIKNPGKFITLAIFEIVVVAVVTGSIYLGILVAPDINARFIYIQALVNVKNTGKAFLFEFFPALYIGFPAALGFLVGYYYFFRKHLSQIKAIAPILDNIRKNIAEKTVFAIEKSRNHLGLGVRIFFNSIVGEIIYRWGIQSLFTFLLLPVTLNLTVSTVTSIIITSAIYGWTHVWLNSTISRDHSGILKIATFSINTGISMVFGILFWRYGIASAMIAHSLLHIIWYPLDIFYYRKAPDEA